MIENFIRNILVFDKIFFKIDKFDCFCLNRYDCKIFVRKGDKKCRCYDFLNINVDFFY